jgi:transposase
MSQPKFIGIDAAKDSHSAASSPSGIALTVPNSPEGRQKLINALKEHTIALVVLEASGGYERTMAADLLDAGFKTVVVNPRQVRDFARGLGELAKTDPIDAKVLARFAEVVQPSSRPKPSAEQVELGELVNRRRQLVNTLTQETNRAEMARLPEVRRSIKKVANLLEAEIERLDEKITKLIEADQTLSQKDNILRSAPGVSKGTSAMLLSRLPELGRLNKREISSLVGLAPWDCKSGTWTGHSRIWGGREDVRTPLYMPTLAAIRFNPAIRAFYKRLRAKGKAAKVAITACMRKMLVTLNTMIRNLTPWREKNN